MNYHSPPPPLPPLSRPIGRACNRPARFSTSKPPKASWRENRCKPSTSSKPRPTPARQAELAHPAWPLGRRLRPGRVASGLALAHPSPVGQRREETRKLRKRGEIPGGEGQRIQAEVRLFGAGLPQAEIGPAQPVRPQTRARARISAPPPTPPLPRAPRHPHQAVADSDPSDPDGAAPLTPTDAASVPVGRAGPTSVRVRPTHPSGGAWRREGRGAAGPPRASQTTLARGLRANPPSPLPFRFWGGNPSSRESPPKPRPPPPTTTTGSRRPHACAQRAGPPRGWCRTGPG